MDIVEGLEMMIASMLLIAVLSVVLSEVLWALWVLITVIPVDIARDIWNACTRPKRTR